MKYDLMKIDDYLFIIGDLYKSDNFPYLVAEKFGTDNNFSIWQVDNPNDLDDKNQYRILAHRPLNGARYLDDIDVLPSLPQEDDVDSICMKDLQDFFGTDIHLTPKGEEYMSIFKTVYNKCREKYKFTEEDLRKGIKMGIQKHPYAFDGKETKYKYSEDEIIQSLQQPKYPIAFECEVEPVVAIDKSGYPTLGTYAPKTIINSEGRTEWVGKYIY